MTHLISHPLIHLAVALFQLLLGPCPEQGRKECGVQSIIGKGSVDARRGRINMRRLPVGRMKPELNAIFPMRPTHSERLKEFS